MKKWIEYFVEYMPFVALGIIALGIAIFTFAVFAVMIADCIKMI